MRRDATKPFAACFTQPRQLANPYGAGNLVFQIINGGCSWCLTDLQNVRIARRRTGMSESMSNPMLLLNSKSVPNVFASGLNYVLY